ncbi:MAG: protein-S-isoprenylcysteine O-methyltransferase [Pseudomonadota bacterium]
MQKIGSAIMTVLFLAIIVAVIWRWEINGWGSLAWVAGMIAINIVRAPHTKANAANVVTNVKEARREKLLLALVGVCGTVLPLLHLATGLLSFADYDAPQWLPVVGLAIFLPGLYLFWRSHKDLGRNWSVTTELREDHTLITDGIYNRIRHPMYSAIFLMFLPQPLFLHNWIAGLAAPLAFVIMYFIRVPYEEAMMREQFGNEYDEYCARTGRLWPS